MLASVFLMRNKPAEPLHRSIKITVFHRWKSSLLSRHLCKEVVSRFSKTSFFFACHLKACWKNVLKGKVKGKNGKGVTFGQSKKLWHGGNTLRTAALRDTILFFCLGCWQRFPVTSLHHLYLKDASFHTTGASIKSICVCVCARALSCMCFVCMHVCLLCANTDTNWIWECKILSL